MAFGPVPLPNMLGGVLTQPAQLQLDGGRETRDELDLGERKPVRVQLRSGMQDPSTALLPSLFEENVILREELRRMHAVVQNSKIDTADLCSMFGKLANEWSKTVKQINGVYDEQKKDYERRIDALEKTNRQLVEENEKMKKVIDDFKKLELEFEKQKRMLKVGQIAYMLEKLVSEYVFPGDDQASKRARYGINLKSIREKIGNLKNKKLQEEAMSRLEGLDEEMFEDWFLGIVKELKKTRVDTAHPGLGTYEEMKSMINEEFRDADKREDMLKALERLQEMYQKLNRNFGVN